jgi:hypothetical protein
VLAIVAAPAAFARQKVFKEIATQATLSATRSTDGGISARVAYTSKDPRCLASKRFKRAGAENNYFQAYAFLLFGSPPGSLGTATLPAHGVLSPVSPFARSPLVWEANFPGNTAVEVTNLASNSERHYEATVSQASALEMYAAAPGSNGQGLPYFKVAYNQGDSRIILKCGQLKGASYSGFAGAQFVVRTFPF